jgi:hypothetical protein
MEYDEDNLISEKKMISVRKGGDVIMEKVKIFVFKF